MIDNTIFQNKKAVYYTLGCKLNFSETATIERIMQEAGIRTARRGEQADICVVNSCAVTQEAEKKCRQAIHKLVRQNPGAFVVVTGCYAQLSAEKLSQELGVDVVGGLGVVGAYLVLAHAREPFAGSPRRFVLAHAGGRLPVAGGRVRVQRAGHPSQSRCHLDASRLSLTTYNSRTAFR